jgi:hypothetical protein
MGGTGSVTGLISLLETVPHKRNEVQAMNYLLPADPATPICSLPCLRSRARRAGYRIARDRYAETFSLIDTRLRVPLLGLDHVELSAIARAVEAAK